MNNFVPETVLAYIKKDNCFLMLYRNKKSEDVNIGKWLGVGGHVEAGETPDMALIREIKEETGLNVVSYKYKGIVYFNYGDYREKMYLYLVEKVDGEIIDCDEGELKYIPIDEIQHLNIWDGDKIFMPYLIENKPLFVLELFYDDNVLTSYNFLK